MRYLDPNRHSKTSLFNWLINVSSKPQQRTDAYSGCSTEKTVVKEMEGNTDIKEMFVLQHDTS